MMNEFESLLEIVERGKNIYYHLTPDDYGPVVEFYPRRPQSAISDEPDDPRICVSPSLAGCLVAASFSWSAQSVVHVYATHAEAIPIDPEVVFDAGVTEEHWIMEPAVFVRVGEINTSKIGAEAREYMDNVYMPYDYSAERQDGDPDYVPSVVYHQAAKDEVEHDLSGIEESIHKTAIEKLGSIIPRVKDVPGQGLFYFAKGLNSKESEQHKEEEPALAEAEDGVEKMEIPKVKAPGNFNQFIARKGSDDDKGSSI